jgi:hypothetical protein
MRVPWGQRWIGGFFAHWPGVGKALGDLETRVLGGSIADVRIKSPVFICGLARSGSTILLEALNAHPAFTAHRYSDYPPLWTPYWWNALRAQLPLPKASTHERAHADGIRITPDSPEAFEEVLWMHFFPDCHAPETNQLLDEQTSNPAFEAFYTAHIRKLLAVRGTARYLSKGNYNIARLAYLRQLFPDARFLIPVRNPPDHVASLIKQDRLFRRAAEIEPAVAVQLARIGHFEFGPHKRAQNLGDHDHVREIAERHARGDACGAYALQWAGVYSSALDQLQADPGLAAACRFVCYERLCQEPLATLRDVFAHADAQDEDGERIIGDFATRMRAPDYYRADFTAAEYATIAAITGPVAERLAACESC